MTIKESILEAIKRMFIHSLFRSRSAEYITELCNSKHKGSDTMRFLPPIPKVEVKALDDTHDQWALVFDDLTIECIVTWRPSKMKVGQFVLEGIE